MSFLYIVDACNLNSYTVLLSKERYQSLSSLVIFISLNRLRMTIQIFKNSFLVFPWEPSHNMESSFWKLLIDKLSHETHSEVY